MEIIYNDLTKHIEYHNVEITIKQGDYNYFYIKPLILEEYPLSHYIEDVCEFDDNRIQR